jgi:hypothetical protein
MDHLPRASSCSLGCHQAAFSQVPTELHDILSANVFPVENFDPLVNIQKAIENGDLVRGFSH